MSKETLLILSRINTISAILIFLIFYLRKDLWKTQFKWVGILLIGSFGFDIIGQILYSNNLNANIAINSWKIFENVVGSILFFYFFKSKSIKSILLGIIVLFPIFSVINLFFIQGPNVLNTYTRTLSCILFILYSVYFFFELLRDLPTSRLTKFPMFWISTGVLLYFSGTVILDLSISYLVNRLNSNLIFFWIFLFVLNFLRNILFGIGSWYKLKSIATT